MLILPWKLPISERGREGEKEKEKEEEEKKKKKRKMRREEGEGEEGDRKGGGRRGGQRGEGGSRGLLTPSLLPSGQVSSCLHTAFTDVGSTRFHSRPHYGSATLFL